MDLFALAHSMGAHVQYGYPPGQRWGAWYSERQVILLRPDLAPTQRKYVLAHEVGHVHLGHTGLCPSEEFQADLYAARLLIHPDHYYESAQFYDDHYTVAEDLGVMPHLVKLFHKHIERKT